MADVGYLLLGWLLGALSPLITRHGERKRRKAEIAQGLAAELSELRVRLAVACFLITVRYGVFNREFLKWLKPLMDNYSGAHPIASFVENLPKVLEFSDEQIALYAATERAKPDMSLSLKKYRLPYVEANLSNLDLFSERTKMLLIETAAQIEAMNEEIDQVRLYYGLTFEPGISQVNHERACQSIKESCLNVGRTGREVIRRLVELEESFQRGAI